MSRTLLNRLLAPAVTVWTDVRNVFTKHQGFPPATLTDQATIAWDGETQQNAKVTRGASRTMGTPTNLVAGTYYTLEIIQDATGGRTLDLTASIFKPANGATMLIGTTANQSSLLTCYYNGSKLLSTLTKF